MNLYLNFQFFVCYVYTSSQSKILAPSLVIVCHPKLQLNLSKQNEISDSLKNDKIPTNKNVRKKFSNSHTPISRCVFKENKW